MIPRKVISFFTSEYIEDDFTSSHGVAAFENILWPCSCFTASIPYRGKGRLNIFEEIILGLTAVGNGSTTELVEISCLNKDLVLFIQNRLLLMGYLDSRNEITDLGRTILAKKESDEDKNFASVRLFSDEVSGKLLPYAHKRVLEAKTVTFNDKNHIKFLMKPTNSRYVNATLIKEGRKGRCPKPQEVIRAIRAFHKRFSLCAEVTGNYDASPPFIPSESSIFVNEESEQVFIHCRAFIQESNPEDLVVTDGFGFGYSKLFADHVKHEHPDIFRKLKEQALIKLTGNVEEGHKKSFKRVHPIVHLVNKSKKALEESKNAEISGKAEEEERKEKLATAIGNLYEAVERTFVHVVHENPVSEWISIYSTQSSHVERNDTLIDFAKKIGLTVDKKKQSILNVKIGAIRAMSIDKPDMEASLALVITGAANSENHPFKKMALEWPDFLSIIREFKSVRDSVQHGKIDAPKLQEKVQFYLEKTEIIIAALQPKLYSQFESSTYIKDTAVFDTDIERINQQRLEASIELDKYFGISTMHNLNKDLKELLMKISIFSVVKNVDNLQRAINNLSSAMQIMYHEAVMSVNILNTDNQQSMSIKATAFGKAVRHSFVSNIAEIHDVFKNVDEEKLKSIAFGESYSLQSNFILFLCHCEDGDLKKIHERCPKLLDITKELALKRGHGTTDFALIAEENAMDDFLRLKDDVYNAIKAVMEALHV